MDAFPTPEEARDEINVLLHIAEKRLNKIDRALKKAWQTECLVTVLVASSLLFGGTLVLENSLKQQAKINQENVIAWAK
ncbi:hypothetical protein [Agrobacterium rubi]|uniref:hypothetical protein n=1 Tax=Agrobacterium rubi TaxID=28099 RepID=UPI0015723323|nr:hypothetical protein [Agrobacterium rubi]NTE87246.1 hypothetical protein [Agrobacterium rubi]NTF03180.1 hypothetical protein [Agrobacterium rubi]